MLIKKVAPPINILYTSIYYNFTSAINYKKDYYKILGIPKTSSQSQIKRQYYKLALKYHPDHNKGTQSKFKQINQAYTILSNPVTKKQYEMAQHTNHNNYSQSQYPNPYPHSHTYARSRYDQQQWQDYADPQQRQRQAQRQYYRQHKQWQSNTSSSYEYANPYSQYQRYRQHVQRTQRQFLRRQKQKYQQKYSQQYQQHKSQTQPQQTSNNYSKKLSNRRKQSFMTGFIITLLLLIPQIIIKTKQQQNRNKYSSRVTNKSGYPYQIVQSK